MTHMYAIFILPMLDSNKFSFPLSDVTNSEHKLREFSISQTMYSNDHGNYDANCIYPCRSWSFSNWSIILGTLPNISRIQVWEWRLRIYASCTVHPVFVSSLGGTSSSQILLYYDKVEWMYYLSDRVTSPTVNTNCVNSQLSNRLF